jgi:anti-sigma regulatory factor (Ser/Thr protein kinase)
MQRHAIAVAIVLEALQIGVAILVVMEDRGPAIAAGEDVIEPTWDVEACLAGHEGERSG